MKNDRDYPKFVVTEKGARWAASGHPWIYEGEVLSDCEEAENGCIVDAVSEHGIYRFRISQQKQQNPYPFGIAQRQ